MVDPARQSRAPRSATQQFRRHDRRKGERDDAGDRHRARQREGELAEERAGQATLKTDRRIDRRQGDGHGDDRADQFARAEQGGVQRRQSFAQMALDVLDHDDGIVHDQTDREHDGEQGEKVDGEPEDLHEENGADQRNRDRHHRHEHGTERSEEEKMTMATMSSVSVRVFKTSWIALLM